ncbi:hypothetical protein CXB51_011271 [Gossypium anomalum]|uniref:mitogen-activated protein kinase kinase kinase n=1 Tax=Gossypium anomalum TaxID=47600 RepID=A0A8J5YP80_9ROSI|nr:hypothetical protein CXB51_011271 [Gossypium anomalum]
MHYLPRFFSRRSAMYSKRSRSKPRLERRNAAKHIDYDAASFSSSLDDTSSSSSLITRSLDLSDKTSFRIQGTEGEFDLICRTLGLSGPEDFSIPAAAWESRKIRSSSDLLPRSRLNRLDSPEEETGKIILEDGTEVTVSELTDRVLASALTEDDSPELKLNECCCDDRNLVDVATSTELKSNACWVSNVVDGGGNYGIKGIRPPGLKPPPVMKLPVVDSACSTWDLFRDFAPEDDRGCIVQVHLHSSSDEEEVKGEKDRGNEENAKEEDNSMRIGETAVLSESCSFITSNDDDSSSSTTEPMSNISPNGRFKRTITYWEKGELLGRGSFGSVFEGISDDGFFFAVKEVSLLDQGSQGKQSIIQLEHEIALLSQFEHENIVQYYGTDKDQSKLYIFLELVTKGSLLNLYQRYHLRDSQVSAYTRQILHGLKYLHDQNVVHRDIKCANILVDASGSVKLSDFGLAKATKFNDVKSCKGTAFWMAPEVVNRKGQGYGLPADIWSLGCTVLEMLTRQIPYYYLEHMQALFRIGRGEPPAVPDSLSKDARDFILQCLQVNPDARPTAAKLLQHPFVKRSFPTHSGSASPHLGRRI